MSFEKIIRIPKDRIGALIGKSGSAKLKIENSCSVRLEINSENGEIQIITNTIDEKFQPFKAMEIITAIGRGFSTEKAMRLHKGENT